MEKNCKGNAKLGNLFEGNRVTEITIKALNGQTVVMTPNPETGECDFECKEADFDGFKPQISLHLVVEAEENGGLLGFVNMSPENKKAVVKTLMPDPMEMLFGMLGGCDCDDCEED